MKFEDLKFERQLMGGFGSTTKINGYTLSVQCSSFHYCTPRLNLSSAEDYSSFEIAVIDNSKKAFVTSDFIEDAYGEVPGGVQGWVTREEINKVIKRIEEK